MYTLFIIIIIPITFAMICTHTTIPVPSTENKRREKRSPQILLKFSSYCRVHAHRFQDFKLIRRMRKTQLRLTQSNILSVCANNTISSNALWRKKIAENVSEEKQVVVAWSSPCIKNYFQRAPFSIYLLNVECFAGRSFLKFLYVFSGSSLLFHDGEEHFRICVCNGF